MHESPVDRARSQPRIEALDGLRGVAASMVLLHHVALPYLAFARGYLSVDFFFLLSGYVIGRSYEAKLARDLSVRAYMIQRIERLYPMLFIGGVLGLLSFPFHDRDGYFAPSGDFSMAGALLSQFLLIPFLTAKTAFIFNVPQWSVMFELIVNLFHAAFRVVLVNIVLLLVVIASGAVLIYLDRQHWHLNFGWGIDNIWQGLPRVLFGFFAGILFWRFEPLWLKRVPSIPFWLTALILVVAVGFPDFPQSGRFHQFRDALVVLGVFPLVLLLGRKAEGWRRLSAALGTLSYPLYAIHTPILAMLYVVGERIGIFGSALLAPAALLACAGIMASAWCLGRYVDEPLNNWRRTARRARSS